MTGDFSHRLDGRIKEAHEPKPMSLEARAAIGGAGAGVFVAAIMVLTAWLIS